MTKYVAVAEFEHNGKTISPGAEIDLDDASAKYLLRGGAIKASAEKVAVKKEK